MSVALDHHFVLIALRVDAIAIGLARDALVIEYQLDGVLFREEFASEVDKAEDEIIAGFLLSTFISALDGAEDRREDLLDERRSASFGSGVRQEIGVEVGAGVLVEVQHVLQFAAGDVIFGPDDFRVVVVVFEGLESEAGRFAVIAMM